MAIAFVNAMAGGSDSVAVVNTDSTIAVTTGNLLVVGAKFRDPLAGDTITITNSSTAQTWHGIDLGGGNIYKEDVANLITMAMFWAVATATESISFTATTGNTHRLPAISVMQFSGAHATAPLDQVASGSTVSTDTVTTGSFTPTDANAVAASFGAYYSGFNVVNPDTGYTHPSASLDTYAVGIAGQYKLAAGAGSQTTTIGQGANTIGVIISASFLPAGAGAPSNWGRMLGGELNRLVRPIYD